MITCVRPYEDAAGLASADRIRVTDSNRHHPGLNQTPVKWLVSSESEASAQIDRKRRLLDKQPKRFGSILVPDVLFPRVESLNVNRSSFKLESSVTSSLRCGSERRRSVSV